MSFFKVSKQVVFSSLLMVAATGCVCKPKQSPSEGVIPIAKEDGLFKDARFGYDSYSLTREAREVLTANAEIFEADKSLKGTVEGHCDERGTNEYNMALGARRAEAAKDFLVQLGVDESRLTTISYGEEVPVDPRSNEQAWAKNRRVHISPAQ